MLITNCLKVMENVCTGFPMDFKNQHRILRSCLGRILKIWKKRKDLSDQKSFVSYLYLLLQVTEF